MCFGYAAIVHDARPATPILGELNDAIVKQISIETAQPRLDYAVLDQLPDKHIILGVLDLGDPEWSSPRPLPSGSETRFATCPRTDLTIAPDCGMKYLPRATAFAKLRAMVEGTRIVRAELG